MPKIVIKLEIEECRNCPLSKTSRGQGGCSTARYCSTIPWDPKVKYTWGGMDKSLGRLLGSYIEWPSEEPKVPHWCPNLKLESKEEMAKAKRQYIEIEIGRLGEQINEIAKKKEALEKKVLAHLI